MRINLRELFEYKGVEYEYRAVIYEGDDAYTYPDKIQDLDRTDKEPLGADIWEEVEEAALNHAYESLRKSRGLKGSPALFYNSIEKTEDGWVVNVDEQRTDAFCELIKACGNVIHSVKPVAVTHSVNIAYGLAKSG